MTAVLERLRQHPLLVSVLLGALFGALLGLLRPLASAASLRAPAEIGWSLPPMAVVSRFDDKQFAAVQQRQMFGAAAAAGSGAVGSAQARRWRLTGIILAPTPIALVLADGDSQVARVPIDGVLPDGGMLRAVDAGGIEYRRDDCQWRRVLYAAADAVDESRCDAEAVRDDAAQGKP